MDDVPRNTPSPVTSLQPTASHPHPHHHHHQPGEKPDESWVDESGDGALAPGRPDASVLASASHEAHEPDEVTYPEGGLRAWLVVLGSWAGLVACFGMMNSIGAFQAYLSEHALSGYSEGDVGWILSLYVFLAFGCGILFGPFFDTHGPRLLIFAGSVIIVSSTFLISLSTEYWHFLLSFGLLGGVGCSLIFTPSFTAPGHYFLKKRGMATGIATTGGSVGGIIFPLVLEKLIPKIGFAWATRVLAFVILFLTVIANLLIRSRLRPLAGATSRPSLRILRQPAFACVTVATFLMELALFIPLSYVTSYGIASGIPTSLAYQLLAVLNAGSVVGRWLAGFVADRIGRFNTLVVFVFVCLASTVGLWLPAAGSPGVMVAYAAVFGLASGSNISLTPVCVGQLCKTEEYGRYYATCYTIVSFGALVGIPIGGHILRACGGEYWGLISFASASYVSSLVFVVLARALGSDWRLKTIF